MDEHIGLTAKVAASILGRPSLAALLLDPNATVVAGTAQRVHNALVQFPAVLQDKRVQHNVFQAMETLLPALGKWPPSFWRALSNSGDQDSSNTDDAAPSSLARLYLVAMLLRLLSHHRHAFSPKQQQRLGEWRGQLLRRITKDAADEASPSQSDASDDEDSALSVLKQLQRVRADFAAHDPFAHLQLAPFTVPGLSKAQLQAHMATGGTARGKGKSAAAAPPVALSPAVPHIRSSDAVLFSHLPRSSCPSCGRVQPFYCTFCLRVLHPLAVGRLPQVELPVHVDIVLHGNVARHKSTALQMLLLAHPRERVTEHAFPGPLVAWDPATTVVVFPSERALTVQQLAAHLRSGGSAGATSSAVASSSSGGDTAVSPSLTSLQHLVFLEGTWGEAEAMLTHPRLQGLTHVRLDFAHTAPAQSSAAGDAAGDAAGSAPPCTAFWRFQRFGASFLSSIEAVYHTLRQLDEHGLMPPRADPSQAEAASGTAPVAQSARFDKVLWLFAMAYERVRTHYAKQPDLLPPVQVAE